jgi:hypothetical protein
MPSHRGMSVPYPSIVPLFARLAIAQDQPIALNLMFAEDHSGNIFEHNLFNLSPFFLFLSQSSFTIT